ncbi:ATP-binding cassette domain-containing protein [Dysgonomonas sp. 216]|uniref:ABC transporter ATP-binding protein n=1 Tax=Dysgonomonas sp. 216 TaxID=2302934 RepID=UPI0013D38FFE|nr:ATP-binding cassette domain-containing protein [Dysgonomonas sp. 216]NDW18195.1 ATP-binding cassette domain-containing protein [Dysgonomonas sp. 216]
MIKVKNISKKYGQIQAIENISFDLGDGEIVGLLGPNGAGKSTTMKIVTGVLSPDSGSVNVLGFDISQNPIKAKQRLGYLSEDNPLPSEMYVREYLEYVAGVYKTPNIKDKVSSCIEQFGLKNEYKKKIQALSKGNRQKLGLAQSLIHNPDFLVLDEPTSALDPGQQEEIQEIIKNLAKSKTVLLSTHLLHEIRNIASRILIINNGQLVADEKTENINSVTDLYHSVVK